MVELRLITLAVADTFKTVRLRALLDTPTAFGSTHAKEVQLTDSDWQARAVQWNGERSTAYLAFAGQKPCGIAAGFLDHSDASKAHLVSMWVAPTHRERGVGKQLVEAVVGWARLRHADTLHLMVTSNNGTAIWFYERLGFVRTGRTEPYPNDPTLVEYEMHRRIGTGGNPRAKSASGPPQA